MRIGLQTWGSEGDIRPVLALAAGLASRGHDVRMVVTGRPEAEHRAIAARSGIALEVTDAAGLDTEVLDRLLTAWVEAGHPLRQARMVLADAVDPAVPAMTDAARALCGWADLVVGHFFVHPLPAIAEARGIPYVALHLAHTGLPSRDLCPPGFPSWGALGRRLGWAITRRVIDGLFRDRVNASRAAAGLPPVSDVMRSVWASPLLTLVAVSPHVCPPPRDWPPSYQVCGFLDLAATPAPVPALDEGLDAFLAEGDPPVYFTFGSLLPRMPAAAAAMGRTWHEAARLASCRAVLQLPTGVAPGRSADGQSFVVRRAPHAAVLPRCALVVHHGGAGTVHATLSAGTPSLVVPHIADQFFWGDELHRLGVAGTAIPRRRLTATRLGRGVARALGDTPLRERARRLPARLAADRGVDRACDLIEQVYRRRYDSSQGGDSCPTHDPNSSRPS